MNGGDDSESLGVQGWELVGVIPAASVTGIRVSEVIVFLKRERSALP
jgi:hypothetical protein